MQGGKVAARAYRLELEIDRKPQVCYFFKLIN